MSKRKHWLVLIYYLLVLVAFWGTTLHWQTSLLNANSHWGMAAWQLIKVLGAMIALIVPIMIGYQQGNSKQRWILGWEYGIVGFLTFSLAHWTTPTNSTLEQYLVQQIFMTWLGSLILWVFAPNFHHVLHHWSITTRRQITLLLIGLFLAFHLLGWQKLLGFAGGDSLVWLAFLFTIGDWLNNDRQWWHQLPQWLLFLGATISWLLTTAVIWLQNSRINYNPHRGLTVDNFHHLVGIAPCQPLLLITVILLLMTVAYHRLSFQSINLEQGLLTLNLLGVPVALAPIIKQGPVVIALLIVLTTITIIYLPRFLYFVNTDLLNRQFNIQKFNRWGSQTLRYGWPLLLTYLILWLLTVISFFMLWKHNWIMVEWALTQRAAIINVNTCIVFAVCLVLMTITNHWWLSSGITIIFYLGWLIASQLKITAREEPILPTDLTTLTAPREMLGMVDSRIIISVVTGAAILIILCGILDHHYCKPKFHWWGRLGIALVAIIFLGTFTRANHSNSVAFKQLQKYHDIPYFYKQIRGAQMNGTLLQFANNIDVHVMNKPQGYSAAHMQQIARYYTSIGAQINQHRQHSTTGRQNLAFVLSESFADPARLPGIHIHGGDSLPFLHHLQKTTTSGLMLSSGYGGGTANMEYQALTGLAMANFSPTMPTPYSQLVPYQKHPWSINQLFTDSIAIHPFTANLYNRKTVYHKFNFAKFYYIDSPNKLTYTNKIQHNPKISDASAYQEITLNLRRQPHGKFVQVATMQNHMPYQPSYYKKDHFQVSGDGFNNEQCAQIETYLQGINYTDQALQAWLRQLDKLDQPTTVVWYGDHLPGIYNRISMTKYGIPLHETDYFIYSNKAARRIDHDRIDNQYQLVSPNVFGALTLAKMDIKVSPYYALLTEVMNKLPATSLPLDGSAKNNAAHQAGISFVNQHGKQVRLNRHQQRLFHDYQLVQYDLTAGHGYLLKDSFLKKIAK